MVNLKKQILKEIDTNEVDFTEVKKFNSAINVSEEDWNKIHLWLGYCTDSLFYRPNKTCLVFTGTKDIINEVALSNVFQYNKTCNINDYYGSFICNNVDFCDYEYEEYKKFAELLMSDCFFVEEPKENEWKPIVFKRNLNYIAAIERFAFPQRKQFIVVDIISANIDLLNSIDALSFWQEVFINFKK